MLNCSYNVSSLNAQIGAVGPSQVRDFSVCTGHASHACLQIAYNSAMSTCTCLNGL